MCSLARLRVIPPARSRDEEHSKTPFPTFCPWSFLPSPCVFECPFFCVRLRDRNPEPEFDVDDRTSGPGEEKCCPSPPLSGCGPRHEPIPTQCDRCRTEETGDGTARTAAGRFRGILGDRYDLARARTRG